MTSHSLPYTFPDNFPEKTSPSVSTLG